MKDSDRNKEMRLLPVISWLLCLSICDSYRFLGVFPFHGKSHFVMFEALMKGLARKGHQVDVISTFPLKKPYPNYNDVVTLQAPMQLMNNLTYDMMHELITWNVAKTVALIGGNNICQYIGKPEILELIKNPPKDPPYDAVLLEVCSTELNPLYTMYTQLRPLRTFHIDKVMTRYNTINVITRYNTINSS